MKKPKRKIEAVFAVLLCANILWMAGCGKTERESQQTGMEAQPIISEQQQGSMEVPSATDTDRMQGNRKTVAEYEAEDRARRAQLEDQVKKADGISEEEAVEIARKAMEADLGEKAKELELCMDEKFGWCSDLCVADWSEIKEKDKGALAYSIGFNNVIEGETEIEDLLNYVCTVNAVDGSILEAYTLQGWDNPPVYYEH